MQPDQRPRWPALPAHRRADLSSGLRQLALGGLAVAITYGVGTLIGHHAG